MFRACPLLRGRPEEAFTDAASMSVPRSGDGCAVLKEGRVLVAGGGSATSNSTNLRLTPGPSFDSKVQRSGGTTVTALVDGRVLITAGKAIEIEVFDPDTSTLIALPRVLTPRERNSVTPLRDGRLLIVGGMGDAGPLRTAEILDVDTGAVTSMEPT
jgi:hypothetical protein